MIDFSKHPVYENLKKTLLQKPSKLTIIEVQGVPTIVHELFVAMLAADISHNVLYIDRENAELIRYLQSTEEYELDDLTPRQLQNILENNNFTRYPKISDCMQYAILGDVISFWLPGDKKPIRVSYFGDEYEKSEYYDDIYGKAEKKINNVFIGDVSYIESQTSLTSLRSVGDHQLTSRNVLHFTNEYSANSFDIVYAQLYFNRFDLLQREIERKSSLGFDIRIFTHNVDSLPKEIQKFVKGKISPLDAGIESQTLKIMYLTDRELFGTVFLARQVKRISSKRARKLLANLEGEIEIGDYVVHEDYGVGIYEGIQQESRKEEVMIGLGERQIREIKEDYIKIAFAGNDELFVPLSQIDKVTKYINSGEAEPRLTSLGRGEWARLKGKAKAEIAAMAKELAEHYAKRELAKPLPIKIDQTAGYDKFLSGFGYEETPDQLRAEREIMTDLQSGKIMNRLIVGDVGFGKTEVAMRACYHAVKSGYQVAILCPTTVLASQHEKVFTERFAKSDMKVAAMSRFTASEHKEIIKKIADGNVDIVVGTHRLLSSDIKFKKLGLIVIDEEQRFGVKQKEKLKKIEYSVHTLTMSATPIPRTLSMALSALQDISLINTPPNGRKSIETIVDKFNYNKVATAITYEVERGGQIYYLHNKVATIQSTCAKLQKLLPGVRFVYAHGSMPPHKLEEIFNDFYDKKYDCLICTTIIENGLDMPNVNTIIIEGAQNFGLGQLHQLRGRVGRGARQAFAYFFYLGENLKTADIPTDPEQKNVKKRPKKYKDRLQAIVDSTDLGSGFQLASRDLEIRGAGNLLGREQHGNMSFMGYGLYMQMLAEEIDRLKAA